MGKFDTACYWGTINADLTKQQFDDLVREYINNRLQNKCMYVCFALS